MRKQHVACRLGISAVHHDGQLSGNNTEDQHGFDLRWDPQLLDSNSQLIRETNKLYSN